MHTMMKVVAYAKLLRDKKTELQKERTAKLATYNRELRVFKQEVILWMRRNIEKEINALSTAAIERGFDYGKNFRPWSMGIGHHDFPKPPLHPGAAYKSRIAKIDSRLRFLAITGKKEIAFDEEEMEKYLGPVKVKGED
jgi:hypothetical protein